MTHALTTGAPGRWERVLRSTWGQAVACALLVTTVLATALVLEQWHTWTQPDRVATVELASFTGHDRYCGKGCRCPEMEFTTVEPAADGVHTTGRATFRDCAHQYGIADTLVVRHWRGNPGRVDAEPLAGIWVAPACLGTGLLTAGVLLLGAWVSAAWRRRTHLRRRRPHGVSR